MKKWAYEMLIATVALTIFGMTMAACSKDECPEQGDVVAAMQCVGSLAVGGCKQYDRNNDQTIGLDDVNAIKRELQDCE